MSEEIQTTRPNIQPIDIIEGMKSGIPLFISFSGDSNQNEVVEITRWGQFIVKYGGFKKVGYLATSIKGYFENHGSRCYVLNLGTRPDILENAIKLVEEGLNNLVDNDISLIIFPGEHDSNIHSAVLDFAKTKGIFAILDGPEELVTPVVKENIEPEEGLTTEPNKNLEENEHEYENMPIISGENGIVVYPWIYLHDPVLGNRYIPASGHIAGIMDKLSKETHRPLQTSINGAKWMKTDFSDDEISRYRGRGVSFLRYIGEFKKLPTFIIQEI